MLYQFGDCELDVRTRELRVSGGLRAVEPQVFDLLTFLLENRHRVLSRDEIFRSVWRGRIVSDSVLGTRVNAARQAIGDDGARQQFIRTLRRNGYRFIGDVREARADAVKSAPALTPVGRLAFSFQDAPAIVVLPIENSGGDAAVADSLTEEIVTTLSRVGWLIVISSRSMPIGKADKAELQRLAHKLETRYLFQGSIRHIENRVRISVHLADQVSGHHIWSERYDRDLAHIIATQDDIAEKIVTTIGAELYATEERRIRLKSRESLAAWECVMRALSLMNTRKKESIGTARVLLRKAISIDPACAPAHALLSFVTTLGVHLAWQTRDAAEPLAVHAARTALDLNRHEPWAHVANGYAALFVSNRPEEAIEIFNHALTLNPSLAIAHYLIALSFCFLGKPDKSFAHADLADHAAPYDLLARGNTGAQDNVRATACFVAGRYRAGIDFARKAIAQSPRQVAAHRALILNSAHAGEIECAAAVLPKIGRLAPALTQYIRGLDALYSDRSIYKQYVDGFRVAGLRVS